MHQRVDLCSLCVAALLWGAVAGAAEKMPVDLELALAVDVSMSMDLEEQRVQREGYVAAFRNPQVIEAIRSGFHGRIAVAYLEWAGAANQQVGVEWSLIDGAAAAEAFASRIADLPLSRWRRTSISGALAFAAPLFERNAFQGTRQVIDVSGDGSNNEGAPIEPVRDAVVARGIVINGLPLMLKASRYGGYFDVVDLDLYYEDCVIGGTGAFLVPVRHPSEFPAAIRRKLILEIADRGAPVVLAQGQSLRPKSDCFIGEKLWRQWMERPEQ